MKTACVTTYNPRVSQHAASIRGYYQARALKNQSIEIEYIGMQARARMRIAVAKVIEKQCVVAGSGSSF